MRGLRLPQPANAPAQRTLTPDARRRCCAGSGQEKVARASLKSALERALTRSTYVILDSLNNIKVGGRGGEG